jgi:hypothetical protein
MIFLQLQWPIMKSRRNDLVAVDLLVAKNVARAIKLCNSATSRWEAWWVAAVAVCITKLLP